MMSDLRRLPKTGLKLGLLITFKLSCCLIQFNKSYNLTGSLSDRR